MDSTIPRSLFLLAMILLGGYFAGGETALSYCNRIRMKTLAEEGDKRAKRVVAITDQFDRALVVLLIGNNVIHVAAASVATVLAMDLFAGFPTLAKYASVISTVVLTLAVFIFSETIPKNIARANSDKFAMIISFSVLILMKILTPIAVFFTFISDKAKALFQKGGKNPSMTEEEFATIVDEIEDEGIIDPEESEIIKSAIEFGDGKVSEIMTPISEAVMLPRDVSHETLKKTVMEIKFSRIPVYNGDIDHIVGIIQTSDCLWRLMNDLPVDIGAMLKKPCFARPHMSLNQLFEEMEKKRSHIAIVTDSGKTLGIVTMEDILEEIAGEIDDDDESSIVRPVKKGVVKA